MIDLKLGELTHADIGQMHLYLNYARRHWTRADENPPVGLILCAGKREAGAALGVEVGAVSSGIEVSAKRYRYTGKS